MVGSKQTYCTLLGQKVTTTKDWKKGTLLNSVDLSTRLSGREGVGQKARGQNESNGVLHVFTLW